MATYWLTFRLAADASYDRRYEALVETVRNQTKKWWLETSSFFLFESDGDIDAVAKSVKAAINPSTDIVLIGMPDYKSARIIGASTDKDLFELMPFTKKS